MTQIPAGWYPDPAPDSAPGRQRYWDGTGWTEHVHDPQPVAPPVPAAPSYPSYPEQPAAPAYPPAYPSASPSGPPAYSGPVGYGQALPSGRPTTPDGVPLSGWWWRVLAAVLDAFISFPLLVLASIPVLVWQWDELSAWFSDLSDAVDAGTATPPEPAMFDQTTGPGFALVLSIMLMTALYSIVFLRWKQATPGKLITGLRIRRRETPGGLPWGTILARVGFVAGLSLLAQVPILGFAFALVTLLDYLWPLWDANNQALHDKVARTNVVRPGAQQSAGPQSATEAALPPRW